MPIKRRGSQARRHPSRRVTVPGLLEDRHRPFEELVARALDELPEGIQRLLANVAVVIEDEPSDEQRRASDLDDDDSLYGLYEGISPVVYGADLVPFPNKITLFRLPLEEDFADPRELAREVQKTVIHELGHHAGVGDPFLHSRGF